MVVVGGRKRGRRRRARKNAVYNSAPPDLMWNGDQTMTVGLFTLPPEIRLIVFEFFLHLSLSSRHNGHLKLLQTCAQIAVEAGPVMRQYLCLKDESQIRGLLFDAHRDHLAQVCTAEVANDSRLIRDGETSEVRRRV